MLRLKDIFIWTHSYSGTLVGSNHFRGLPEKQGSINCLRPFNTIPKWPKSSFTLLLLLCIGGGVEASAATYYVDATGGSDQNTGTSVDQAWRTIAKVNKSSLAPGDSVLFKRGEVWREILEIKWSGTKGNPITFADYGSGAEEPVLDGGTIIPPASWAGPDRNGVYSFTLTGEFINAFSEDSVVLPYASNSTLSDGNWYITSSSDSTTVYYKPTSGTPSDHTTERSSRGTCISFTSGNNSFIKIRDLIFVLCSTGIYGTSFAGALHDISIEQSHFYRNSFAAINLKGRNGDGLNNITIQGNRIVNSCESIFIGSYDDGTERNTNIIIKNNKIYNGGLMVRAQSWNLINSCECEGIGLQNIANSTIANNEITGGVEGGAITYWTNEYTFGTTGNQFVKNYIHDILGYGIAPGGGQSDYVSSSITAYNIIENCGKGSKQSVYGGIRLNRRQDSSLKSQIYNNIIYECDIGIYFNAEPDNYIIKNNLIYKNGAKYSYQQIYYEEVGYPPTNLMQNNIIYDPATSNTVYINHVGARTVPYMESNFRSIWAKNVVSNPRFFGSTNTKPYPYFYFQSDSPAIDAGTDIGLTTDYLGVSVPQAAAPDIGAFEVGIQ